MATLLEKIMELQALRDKEKKAERASAAQIWKGIGEKKSFDELGFDTEEDLKKWIDENPYTAIGHD